MVKITFPDGSVRSYEQGVTGLQIAESLSPALARDVVSCGINGETTELNRPINEDASINLYKFSDDEGKHTFWHTSAHLLAEALQELYPGIQFGFGPAVENGFFYDVMPANGQVISENDFPKIEAKMRELAKKNEPVVRREVSKADAIEEFKAMGQDYKVEHIDQDLEDGTITTYTQGSFTDLCRGPHLPNTGLIKAIKLTSVAGAYWRGNEKNKMLTRIYGITFPKKSMLDEYLEGHQDNERGRSLLARRRQARADDAHLWHHLPEEEDARRVSADAGGGQEARPPQDRPRDGPLYDAR